MKVFHVSWNGSETVFHEMLWKKNPSLKIWANFGNFYVKDVLKPCYEDKKLMIFKYKRKTNRFLNVSKKFLLKKLIKWKRPLLTYLEKRNWWKLSEVSRFVRSFTKGFEKKMLWKMHVMESQRHWNLLKPVIIFISTLLGVIQKVRSLRRGGG